MKKVLIILLLSIVISVAFVSADCNLRRLDWNLGTIVEDTDVGINIGVAGDTCQNKSVSLAVKEWDHGGSDLDDSVIGNPSSVKINSNSPQPGTWVSAVGTWRAQWQTDTDHAGETNPPEYYLLATLDGQTYSSKDYFFASPYLNVTEFVPIDSNQEDSPNETLYLPTDCSESEIKAAWNSVFKESSSNVTILVDENHTANNSCYGYFAYKTVNAQTYYLQGGQPEILEGADIVIGANFNSTPNFKEILDSYTDFSEIHLSDIEIIKNYTILRGYEFGVTDFDDDFSTYFKEIPTIWEEDNLINNIPNDTVYNFYKNDNKTTGRMSLKHEFREVAYIVPLKGTNFTLKEEANKSIFEVKDKLAILTSEISEFPVAYRSGLEKVTNIIGIQNNIASLELRYNQSENNTEFIEIINASKRIDIPSELTVTEKADKFTFIPDKRSIELPAIASSGLGEYDLTDEDKYLNSIAEWTENNIDAEFNYQKISGLYSNGERPLLIAFEISINEKRTIEGNYYLFVRNTGGVTFGSAYGEKESGNYYYIPLSRNVRRISFTTTENFDYLSPSVFISPSFDKLDIPQPEPPPKDRISKWWVYAIILFIVLVIGTVLYVVLQRWYTNKYEDYLFKNKNHLFNLVTYINNSRAQGMNDREAENRLKRAGWSGEQLRYGFRKYAGKNTGMPELPLLSGKSKKVPVPSPPPKPIGQPPKIIPRRFR